MLNFTVAATSFTFIDKSKFIKMRFFISTLAAAIAILSVVSAAPQSGSQAARNPLKDVNIDVLVNAVSKVADKLQTKQRGQGSGGQ